MTPPADANRVPGEALGEDDFAASQSARDGSLRPAELLGGFPDGLAFEIAEQNGQPINLGEVAQFLVEQRLQGVRSALRYAPRVRAER